MKCSVGRGESFLGVNLYVLDAKNAPKKEVSREATGPEIALFMESFNRIGAKNGYVTHDFAGIPDAGKPRTLSENRMRKLSERSLVRAIAEAQGTPSVLPTIPFGHRRGPDGVRRKSKPAAAVEPVGVIGAADIGTAGRGIRHVDADGRDADKPLDRSRKLPEVVGGNMGWGELDPRALTKEFSRIRALRKDIKKPVWHCSLALPAGERLDSVKWDVVAQDFMREMGLDPEKHQYVVVRHNDTDYDHVHIVANRIALDGSVWDGKNDVFRAIAATQALERRHGLVLTPGIDAEPPEKKPISQGEIKMGRRTGVAPPRMQLQVMIDNLLAEAPMTAVQFAESLTAMGVEVRANVVSTGKMNGFSFSWCDVPFKSGQLGDGYKWAALQKRGLTYERERDAESLSRFRKPAPDGVAGPSAAVAVDAGDIAGVDQQQHRAGDRADDRPDDRVPGELAGAAGSSGRAADGSDRAADGIAGAGAQGAGLVRPDHAGAALDAGGDDGADHADAAAVDRGQADAVDGIDQRGDAGRDKSPAGHAAFAAADRGDAGALGRSDRPGDDSSSGAGQDQSRSGRIDSAATAGEHRGTGTAGERQLEGAGGDAVSDSTGEQGVSGSDSEKAASMGDASDAGAVHNDGSIWRDRFRQNNATASAGVVGKPVEQSNPAGNRIPEENRRAAREIDPTDYLERAGFTCRKSLGGRQISVRRDGDEYYRVTQKPEGHWVACTHNEFGIGDNIALVMDIEPGLKFQDAVYRLYGSPGMTPMPKITLPPKPPFLMPKQRPVDEARGRSYLHQERGIDLQTIKEAEESGFLCHTNKAVLIVGRDRFGKAMAATRRAAVKDDLHPKVEITGSDKSFVAILKGTSNAAFIVDGGVDALALHSMAKRRGELTPTVYVTGGVGNKSWMDREEIQTQLRGYSTVAIAGENEKDAETQERTDAHRAETKDKLQRITGKQVEIITPPLAHGKDMADRNLMEVQHIRAAEAAAAKAKQARIAEAAQAIIDAQARRVEDLKRLTQPHMEISKQLVGYRSAKALQEASGDASRVDWQAVEDIITHDAIVDRGASPDVVAQSIVAHSPGQADPATHDQARQRVAEAAPALQEERAQEQQQRREQERPGPR